MTEIPHEQDPGISQPIDSITLALDLVQTFHATNVETNPNPSDADLDPWHVDSSYTKDESVDTLEIEFKPNKIGLTEWVRRYTNGRMDLLTQNLEAARTFYGSGQPAEAIVNTRIAREIPSKSGEVFTRDVKPIVDALKISQDELLLRYPKSDIYSNPSTNWFLMYNLAHERAFGYHPDIVDELRTITDLSRLELLGQEIPAWNLAIKHFSEKNDLLGTGVGMIELGDCLSGQGDTDNALLQYRSASYILASLRKSIRQDQEIEDIARVDTITEQFLEAQLAILSTLLQKYPDGKVKTEEDYTLLQRCIYTLDDYGVSRKIVAYGYSFLANQHPVFSREGWFYINEEAYLWREINGREVLSKGDWLMGEFERPNRRHKRP